MRPKSVFLFNLIFLCFVAATLADPVRGQSVPITNPTNGQLIISEFRLRGPNGANDEFVEVYNATASTIRVTDQASDPIYQAQCALNNSCGWALTDLTTFFGGSPKFIIPNGVEIPPYGHYLIANKGTDGYSLDDYASADGIYNASNSVLDLSDDTGIAIFKTAYTAAFDGTNDCVGATPCVLDAAGFANDSPPYREGTGLPLLSEQNTQYSFVRKINSAGFPQDTNNNASDFWLVAPDPSTMIAATAVLGAPGPENLASPINRTSTLKSSLVDLSGGSLGGANAARDNTAGAPDSPTAFGTLTLRRRFTNTTGGTVSRLRLRIANLSTINSPGAGSTQADLRALTSVPQAITVNETPVDVRKAVLEEPPVQTKGGGYNSSLLVDVPGGSLINGSSVVVNITFGVAQRGNFQLSHTVEAVTTPDMLASTTMKSSVTGQRSRKRSK